MSLLATLGLPLPAKPSDLPGVEAERVHRRMKSAVAIIAKMPDPKRRADAVAAMKALEVDRTRAIENTDVRVAHKAIQVVALRLDGLVALWSRPVEETGAAREKVPFRIEDRFTGRTSEVELPWRPGDPDMFELDGQPRGRFAFRIGAGPLPQVPEDVRPDPQPPKQDPVPEKKPVPEKQPVPKKHDPKKKDPEKKPVPPKKDPETQPVPEKKDPEKTDPVPPKPVPPKPVTPPPNPEDDEYTFVEYMKKDFVDTTLTEGMENVSQFTGWMSTGAKMVPGGQGLAAAMETVGLVADITNATYVVIKALRDGSAGGAGGTVADELVSKGGPKLAEKAKKQVAAKISKKYPMLPKPLVEKAVDEIVDRVLGEIGDQAHKGVQDAVDGSGTNLPPAG
jgi:hypothetical protein